jgi:hypothetical protein
MVSLADTFVPTAWTMWPNGEEEEGGRASQPKDIMTLVTDWTGSPTETTHLARHQVSIGKGGQKWRLQIKI